ncbi:MAG: hypothetical protein ABSC23_10790 [Bryobacteraceae bacterium]|jgi:hypothetical protein
MRKSGGGLILSRRGLLILAGAGIMARLRAGELDFWNAKPPQEWSEEEIGKLITDSPWAKQVIVEIVSETPAGSESRGSGQAAAPETRTRGAAGNESPGIGIPRGGARGGAPVPSYRRMGPAATRAAVIWESAQPVLDAVKTPLPGAFADRYVISVRGSLLRAHAAADDANPETLKQSTFLQPKDKPEARPDVLQGASSMAQVFLFGFSKQALAIAPGDQEVLFQTRIGALRVQAKFNPQEMFYQGKLAL